MEKVFLKFMYFYLPYFQKDLLKSGGWGYKLFFFKLKQNEKRCKVVTGNVAIATEKYVLQKNTKIHVN